MRVMGEGDSFLPNHPLSPLLRQVGVKKQHQLRVPGGEGEPDGTLTTRSLCAQQSSAMYSFPFCSVLKRNTLEIVDRISY